MTFLADARRLLGDPSLRNGAILGTALATLLAIPVLAITYSDGGAMEWMAVIVAEWTQPTSWVVLPDRPFWIAWTPFYVLAELTLYGAFVGSLAGFVADVVRWRHWTWSLGIIVLGWAANYMAGRVLRYLLYPDGAG